MNLQIRPALNDELPAILGVVLDAFGAAEGEEIAGLIRDLLVDESARPVLSLVAISGERIVGHILFTRAELHGAGCSVSARLLAPLAVHPDFQSRGIGGRLIAEGLRGLSEQGVDLVFVLGHPGYYPRFGFEEAGANRLEAPYSIAPENAGAWMVRELRPGFVRQVNGRVICADSLDDPKYWRE